jgi:phage tail tape-measure protein
MKGITKFKKGIHDSLAEKVTSRLIELKKEVAERIFAKESVNELDEKVSAGGAIAGGALIGGLIGGPMGAIGGTIGGALSSALGSAYAAKFKKLHGDINQDIKKCNGNKECEYKAHIKRSEEAIKLLKDSKKNNKSKAEIALIDNRIKKLEQNINSYKKKIGTSNK